MYSTMEETKTDIKSKISFSVESLLSSSKTSETIIEKYEEDLDENRLESSSDRLDEEDDEENITVDDEDTDGRDSLSPNSSHTVLVPQPLHPSMPRIIPGGPPQWPFQWITPTGFRSSSPQSKLIATIFSLKKQLLTRNHLYERFNAVRSIDFLLISQK